MKLLKIKKMVEFQKKKTSKTFTDQLKEFLESVKGS